MNQDREQRSFAEKLEDASIEELMPSFNRIAEWGKIEAELQKGRKRRSIVLPLWSYAAAVLLLLTVGYYFTGGSGEQGATSTTASAPVKQNMPVVQPTASATSVAPASPSTSGKVAQIQTKKQLSARTMMPKTTSTPAAQTTPPAQGEIPNEEQIATATGKEKQVIATEKEEQPVAANATPQRRKIAVSILDLENEDKQYMIYEQPVGNPAKNIIARMQSLTTTPDVAANERYYPLQGALKK